MGLGRNINLIEHVHTAIDDVNAYEHLPDIDNLIVSAEKEEDKWIEDTTRLIGDWRSIFRSTYLRWALSINGLHVASEKYSNQDWYNKNSFYVQSIRIGQNGTPEQAKMVTWDGVTAARAHLKTIDMMAAWGLIDLYGCFEEYIFTIYRAYLRYYPESILQGDEFRQLRKLNQMKKQDTSLCLEWENKMKERMDNWQKKRMYDGLDKVFLAYCNITGIKEPSTFKLTNIQRWAEVIKGISLLRNCLIHGVKVVPQELAEYSKKPYSLTFDFVQGNQLKILLHHLQSVELFSNQLLSAINMSLVELMYPDLKKI